SGRLARGQPPTLIRTGAPHRNGCTDRLHRGTGSRGSDDRGEPFIAKRWRNLKRQTETLMQPLHDGGEWRAVENENPVQPRPRHEEVRRRGRGRWTTRTRSALLARPHLHHTAGGLELNGTLRHHHLRPAIARTDVEFGPGIPHDPGFRTDH